MAICYVYLSYIVALFNPQIRPLQTFQYDLMPILISATEIHRGTSSLIHALIENKHCSFYFGCPKNSIQNNILTQYHMNDECQNIAAE